MGKLKLHQPIVWYSRCVSQIRYSHSYKTAPPAAKLQGVIGPLAERPVWIARPTCGLAIGGPSV